MTNAKYTTPSQQRSRVKSQTQSSVGRVGAEVALDEIRRRAGRSGSRSWCATAGRGAWRPGCRARASAAGPDSAARCSPAAQQRLPRAPVAVGLVVGLMDRADDRPAAARPRPLRASARPWPLVVRGRRHAQGLTDELDPEALAVLVDEARSLRSGRIEFLGEIHRRGLQDLVRPAQLAHLALQRS